MDETQKQYELAVGNKLITKLNQKQGTKYTFKQRGDGRGDEGPDLIYRDDNSEIGIEVVTCYYDDSHAKLEWQNARNYPNAPQSWAGVNFNSALIENINKVLQDKCVKNYGRKCLLAVYINPGLTTYNEMDSRLLNIKVPPKHHFAGIYLIGHFGVHGDGGITDAVLEL